MNEAGLDGNDSRPRPGGFADGMDAVIAVVQVWQRRQP